MRFLIAIGLMLLFCALLVLAPEIAKAQKECEERGGIWLYKPMMCVGGK